MTTLTPWTAILAVVVVAVVGQEAQKVSICSVQEINLDNLSTFHLISPNGTQTINPSLGCKVKVIANVPNTYVQLSVVSFSLGGQDPCSTVEEHLTIAFSQTSHYSRGDVDTIRWCGRSHGPVLITREPMELTYNPGSDPAPSGIFEIKLSFAKEVCSPVTMTLDSEPMYIYSPGYPAPYDEKLLDCNWELNAAFAGETLLLDSLRFDVEAHPSCRYDYLEIDNEKFCGDQRVTKRSRRQTMNLYFNTDHSDNGRGFVLKVVQNSKADASCGRTIRVHSTPVLLQVPAMDSDWPVASIHCWWVLDSGRNDNVVVLDTSQFHTTASCSQFELKLYDGMDNTAPRILSHCAPLQMFQTVRSSSRYLYVDIDLGYGRFKAEVSFTAVSSPRDAPPRVLYAGTAASYVWLNLTAYNDLGILIRGREDNPWNYTTCIELEVKETPSGHSLPNASDYFYFFSGWNQSFAELGTACGRTTSEQVRSYGSKIFLKFTPKRTNLWLIYRLQKYCQPGMIPLQSLPRTNQTFQSDKGQNGMYPNNAYCRWFIRQDIPFYFTQVKALQSQLNAENCYDNITVYDVSYGYAGGQSDSRNLLLEWCDAEKPVVLSSEGSSLLVEFITNYRDTAPGFSIEYSSVSLVNECPSMASLMAEKEAKFLTSPNYPNNYPNNVDCKWLIKSDNSAIKLTLLFLSIAQEGAHCIDYDFLVVYDGWHTSSPILVDRCGNGFIQSVFVSTSNHMLVHFKSDGQNTARGFKLQYQNVTDHTSSPCNVQVLVTDDEDRDITSMNYPYSYPSDMDCYWNVRAPTSRVVQLEVVDFDMPSCAMASVSLYDGDSDNSLVIAQLCGNHWIRYYTSSQNNMYIRFRANGSQSKGFKFRLHSWMQDSNQVACQGLALLTASTSKNYIQSPNYPENYPPNSDCSWQIQSAFHNMTVRLEVEDAKLESSFTCNFDSVSIYDGYGESSATRLGKICGEQSATYWSRGLYMYVHFISDDTTQYRGFRLAYWAVTDRSPDLPSGQDSQGSSIGPVVGGVLGGVLFLLVGITVFLCIVKRCKQRRCESPRPSRQSSRGNERSSTVFVMSPVIVNQMPPPPYPGLNNAGFVYDDLPPAYQASHVAPRLPPPPLYAELEGLPPYSENMLESYPPSTPKEGGAPVFSDAEPREPRTRHDQQPRQNLPPHGPQPRENHPPQEQQQQENRPPQEQQQQENRPPQEQPRENRPPQEQQPWENRPPQVQPRYQHPSYQEPPRQNPPSHERQHEPGPSSTPWRQPQQGRQGGEQAPVAHRALQGRAPTTAPAAMLPFVENEETHADPELEALPPYSENMLESYPPSTPTDPKEGGAPVFSGAAPQPGSQEGAGQYSSRQPGRDPENHYHTLVSPASSAGPPPHEQRTRENRPPHEQRLRENRPPHEQRPRENRPHHEQQPRENRSPHRQQPRQNRPPRGQRPRENQLPQEQQQRENRPPQEQQQRENGPPQEQPRDQHPSFQEPPRQNPPSHERRHKPGPSHTPQPQPQQGREQASAPPRTLQVGATPTAPAAMLSFVENEGTHADAEGADHDMAASYV